jgi:hypothetical protein
VPGENRVEKITYSDGKVFINPANISRPPRRSLELQDRWLPVCDNGFKDRKGRVLTGRRHNHYHCRCQSAETIRLMKEIDQAIPKLPMV